MMVAELMIALLDADPNQEVQLGCCVDSEGRSYYATDIEFYRRSPVPLAGKKNLYLIFGKRPVREHDSSKGFTGVPAIRSNRRGRRR